MLKCVRCDEPITSKYGKKFCSIKCSAIHANTFAVLVVRKAKPIGSCKQCGVEFEVLQKGHVFCTRSCAATFNNLNKKVWADCLNMCGRKVGKNSKNYCSHKCAHAYKNGEIIRQWKAGLISGAKKNCPEHLSKPIRDHILDEAGMKCKKCGWGEKNPVNGRVPIQIHHEDGNAQNHAPDNVIVLCPNCHSLTATYGFLNKGSGRKFRRR